jgi:hypothetical protein
MKLHKETPLILWLRFAMVAALGACCTTCAPVDPPSVTHGKTQTTQEPAASQIPVPRTLTPGGLKERIEMAIDQARRRDLLTTNGFWPIFHEILGLGPDAATLLNPDTGKRINALDYICSGGQVRGLRFLSTAHGVDVETAGTPGSVQMFIGQGHQDQFVAEMAQWRLPTNRKFLVEGKECTFMDFVRHTKARARVTENQELSWAILIMGQYFGTDISWTNAAGEKLKFEDLVRYELNQPIDEAACGGTHRLFGLSWVYQIHRAKGGQKDGVWKDVADKAATYQKLARKLQNSDGSLSTDFFKGPGDSADKERRIYTTGHALEWLALSLPDDEIKASWVQDAANRLALTILDVQGMSVETGALYHAVHGLRIYYERIFEPHKPPVDPPIPPPEKK